MGAQKYEISLLVFNSISHCRVEHEKSNHVLFCLLDKHLIDVPVKSTLQHLPPPRVFDAISCPRGRKFDRKTRFHVRCSADSMWVDKSWRRQTFMNSKEKIADS